jgi:hypothetical protein
MNNPTLSTLFVCGSAVAALSLLTAEDEIGGVPDASHLPPAIIDAEADYEVRQCIIEDDLHRWQLSHLDQAPEIRRSKMMEWMEINRQVLEDQVRLSDSIDALYVANRVPPDPNPSEILAARAPAAGQETTPAGRMWKYHYDLALLREAYADNPEALRDAMYQWMQTHEKEMAQTEADLRAEIVASASVEPAPPPESPPLSEIPADAPEDAQQFFRLQKQFAEIMARLPHPALLNKGEASLKECEAWRDAVAKETAEITPQLELLTEEMARKAEQTLARENLYESIH